MPKGMYNKKAAGRGKMSRSMAGGRAEGSYQTARSTNFSGINKRMGNTQTTLGRSATGMGKKRMGKRRGVMQAGDVYCP